MMPLPKPQKDEPRNEFIVRCASDEETLKEFPDSKQRVAVCIGIYNRENKLNEGSNANVSETVEKEVKEKTREDHREKSWKRPEETNDFKAQDCLQSWNKNLQNKSEFG